MYLCISVFVCARVCVTKYNVHISGIIIKSGVCIGKLLGPNSFFTNILLSKDNFYSFSVVGSKCYLLIKNIYNLSQLLVIYNT